MSAAGGVQFFVWPRNGSAAVELQTPLGDGHLLP
jgi:hypothetical protein